MIERPTTMTDSKREKQIPEKQKELDLALAGITGAVDGLRERLNSIMTVPEAGPMASKVEPGAGLCLMAEWISSASRRTREVAHDITLITDSLEL